MVSMSSDAVEMGIMCSFSMFGKLAEIFKYVILCVASNPGTMNFNQHFRNI